MYVTKIYYDILIRFLVINLFSIVLNYYLDCSFCINLHQYNINGYKSFLSNERVVEYHSDVSSVLTEEFMSESDDHDIQTVNVDILTIIHNFYNNILHYCKTNKSYNVYCVHSPFLIRFYNYFFLILIVSYRLAF